MYWPAIEYFYFLTLYDKNVGFCISLLKKVKLNLSLFIVIVIYFGIYFGIYGVRYEWDDKKVFCQIILVYFIFIYNLL